MGGSRGGGGNTYVGNDSNFYLQSVPETYAVLGFVERDEAQRLLSSSPPGTFLLRFSNEVGCVAITWVAVKGATTPPPSGLPARPSVTSVLLKPTRRGLNGWEMDGARYESLAELVMSIEELKWVHPGVEKAKIFGGR